jgi:predicted lipase
VTGHSMGGAMASFCALDLAVSIPRPKGLQRYLLCCLRYF